MRLGFFSFVIISWFLRFLNYFIEGIEYLLLVKIYNSENENFSEL